MKFVQLRARVAMRGCKCSRFITVRSSRPARGDTNASFCRACSRARRTRFLVASTNADSLGGVCLCCARPVAIVDARDTANIVSTTAAVRAWFLRGRTFHEHRVRLCSFLPAQNAQRRTWRYDAGDICTRIWCFTSFYFSRCASQRRCAL